MSSEISSIDRCTGSALSCFATTRPKRRPRAQTTRPASRSEWPVTPRNVSLRRSGRTRFDSPPPCAPAPRTRDCTIEDRIMALTAPSGLRRSRGKPVRCATLRRRPKIGSPDTTDSKGFLASSRPRRSIRPFDCGPAAPALRSGRTGELPEGRLPCGPGPGRRGDRARVEGREIHVEIPSDSAGVHDPLHDAEGHGLVRLDVHEPVPLRVGIRLVDELPALLLVPEPLLDVGDVVLSRVA